MQFGRLLYVWHLASLSGLPLKPRNPGSFNLGMTFPAERAFPARSRFRIPARTCGMSRDIAANERGGEEGLGRVQGKRGRGRGLMRKDGGNIDPLDD